MDLKQQPILGTAAEIAITVSKRHRNATWAQCSRIIGDQIQPWRCDPPSHPVSLGDIWIGETKPDFARAPWI